MNITSKMEKEECSIEAVEDLNSNLYHPANFMDDERKSYSFSKNNDNYECDTGVNVIVITPIEDRYSKKTSNNQ